MTVEERMVEVTKTTRGSDVVSTIRASYYKNGERSITENVMTGKGMKVSWKGLTLKLTELV